MNQSYPVPPPELVQQWTALANEEEGCKVWSAIATQAAQWGADQELEACCSEMDGWGDIQYSAGYKFSKKLRWHRRPKPPSLKEQALAALDALPTPAGQVTTDRLDTIRRAIEQLPD